MTTLTLTIAPPTAPTLAQCIADPDLAEAVCVLAEQLHRHRWTLNDQSSNEKYIAQLEAALEVARAERGPSRMVIGAQEPRYMAMHAAVQALEVQLGRVVSALAEQREAVPDDTDLG